MQFKQRLDVVARFVLISEDSSTSRGEAFHAVVKIVIEKRRGTTGCVSLRLHDDVRELAEDAEVTLRVSRADIDAAISVVLGVARGWHVFTGDNPDFDGSTHAVGEDLPMEWESGSVPTYLAYWGNM